MVDTIIEEELYLQSRKIRAIRAGGITLGFLGLALFSTLPVSPYKPQVQLFEGSSKLLAEYSGEQPHAVLRYAQESISFVRYLDEKQGYSNFESGKLQKEGLDNLEFLLRIYQTELDPEQKNVVVYDPLFDTLSERFQETANSYADLPDPYSGFHRNWAWSIGISCIFLSVAAYASANISQRKLDKLLVQNKDSAA